MNQSGKTYRFFVATMLLLSSLPLQADQAAYWLDKMSTAVHSLNYDGYFIYLHNNSIESLRTVHTVDSGKENERLFSQNGEARELLRDDDSVTRIMPKSRNISTAKRLLNRHSFSGFFRLDADEISRSYDLRFQGKDRVADRAVNVIVFLPDDNFRYGYRLYLDDEFAFPLQWEMFDHQQELVSSIMFTNISISRPEGDAATVFGAVSSEAVPAVQKQVRIRSTSDLDSGWAFNDIPDGYSIRHRSTRKRAGNHSDMNHYLFSDGLSSFSVFIEATDKARLNGKAKLGALNAYGVFIDGHQLTAVGEVPVEALIFLDYARLKGQHK